MGQGSEFVVTLPVALSSGAQAPLVIRKANEAATRSLRVLVVDDNVDTVDSLAMLMKELGPQPSKVEEGARHASAGA